MPIQERTKNGTKQYRWGNSGTWYTNESQAHKQGMAIQAETKRRLYLQKKRHIGKDAVRTQLRKRKMLRQISEGK